MSAGNSVQMVDERGPKDGVISTIEGCQVREFELQRFRAICLHCDWARAWFSFAAVGNGFVVNDKVTVVCRESDSDGNVVDCPPWVVDLLPDRAQANLPEGSSGLLAGMLGRFIWEAYVWLQHNIEYALEQPDGIDIYLHDDIY